MKKIIANSSTASTFTPLLPDESCERLLSLKSESRPRSSMLLMLDMLSGPTESVSNIAKTEEDQAPKLDHKMNC